MMILEICEVKVKGQCLKTFIATHDSYVTKIF